MKKTLKRGLVLLLTLVMVVCVFASCGNDTASVSSNENNDDFFTDDSTVVSSNNTGSDDTTSSNVSNGGGTTVVGESDWQTLLNSMPKELKGTSITIANWNAANEYNGASTAIANFTKETGIKVNWLTINYNEYASKLASLVASDDSPDVARTRTPSALEMQSFQPLSTTKFDFSDEAWDQTLMKDYSINGKVYATSLKGTHIGAVVTLFYNKALIDEYDFENPYQLWKNGKWTWDTFLKMCRDFQKESKNKSAAGGNGWNNWVSIYGVQGPIVFDGKTYKSNITNSTFLKATQEIADLYNTEQIFMRWGANEFDRGELLFWSGGSIYARRTNAYFASLKAAGTLYSVPMPSVDGQSTYYQGRHEYEAYAVVSGAKNPTAVPYFLRYFLDPQNYDQNAFWINSQAQEVYNWSISQKNTVWPYYYENENAFDAITELKGNQIKSFVDSNAAIIEQSVKDLNGAVSKLK